VKFSKTKTQELSVISKVQTQNHYEFAACHLEYINLTGILTTLFPEKYQDDIDLYNTQACKKKGRETKGIMEIKDAD